MYNISLSGNTINFDNLNNISSTTVSSAGITSMPNFILEEEDTVYDLGKLYKKILRKEIINRYKKLKLR